MEDSRGSEMTNTAATTSTSTSAGSKKATIYRMVMPDHVCPYGLKTLDLLQRQGFEVNDVHLETDAETTAFREKWDVETTPQTFVDGELVGTLDDVREYVGKDRNDGDETSYRPVLTLFAITFLMAIGAASIAEDQWFGVRTVE